MLTTLFAAITGATVTGLVARNQVLRACFRFREPTSVPENHQEVSTKIANVVGITSALTFPVTGPYMVYRQIQKLWGCKSISECKHTYETDDHIFILDKQKGEDVFYATYKTKE